MCVCVWGYIIVLFLSFHFFSFHFSVYVWDTLKLYKSFSTEIVVVVVVVVVVAVFIIFGGSGESKMEHVTGFYGMEGRGPAI